MRFCFYEIRVKFSAALFDFRFGHAYLSAFAKKGSQRTEILVLADRLRRSLSRFRFRLRRFDKKTFSAQPVITRHAHDKAVTATRRGKSEKVQPFPI
jgi:hypothetical protein